MHRCAANPVAERVLVLMHRPGDAAITAQTLCDAGIDAAVAEGVDRLCDSIVDASVGAVVLTDEYLTHAVIERLLEALRAQPAWSDAPLIVLAGAGAAEGGAWSAIGDLEPLSTVTLLERPLRPATLVSATLVALRARRRQREIKAHIEERERAAEALRESEEVYRMVGEAAPDFLWSTDAEGELDYVNKRWQEYTGLTIEAFNELGWESLHHPDDLQSLRDWWMQANESGETRDVEFRCRRHDGEYRWFMARMAPVRDGAGRIVRWVGTATDIDDKRRAAEALRESEERFRVMADAAPVMIWLADERQRGTYFNRSWLEFSGRTQAEESADGWTELVHPADRDRIVRVRGEAFERREPFNAEFRLRRRGGEYRWLIDRGVPRFSPDGAFLGFIGSCTDITDRKRAEERLAAEHAVTRILAEAQSLDEAAPSIIRVICDAFAPRIGALWLPDAAGKLLRCALIRPCDGQAETTCIDEVSGGFEYEIGRGLPGRAWANHAPVWVPDLLSDGEFLRAEMAAALGLRSAVAFPIVAGREFFGVLEFFYDRASAPDKSIMNMMNAVGSEIGQFILRRRAEHEVERLNRDLQLRINELQTLLDVAPIGVAVARDPDCDVVVVNPAGAALLGVEAGPNMAPSRLDRNLLPFRVFRDGEELAPDEQPMRRAITEGAPVLDVNVDVLRRDGRTVRLSAYASPLYDESGAVRGCLGLFVDMTERARGEAALRESEGLLRAVVETAADGIMTVDETLVVRTMNPAAERIFERSAKKVIGVAVDELIPGAARAGLLAQRSGLEAREAQGRRRDGALFPLEVAVGETRLGDKRILTAIVRDITARKEAERALRESETRLKIALEAGRMGAWEWHVPSGRVTWSPTLEQIHGVEPGSFGGTIDDYQRDIHPDDFELVAGAIERALKAGEDYHIIYRIIRPDGAVAWLESRGRVFADERGEPIRMAGVCADITERRLAEAELARHRDRLAELVRERTLALETSHQRLRLSERMAALGTLSAGLGHDMANMLLPVRVRLDSMERRGGAPEGQEDLKAVRSAVEYLQRLAMGLRLLSLDPDDPGATSAATALDEWWEDVLPTLRNVLPRHIALEKGFADPAPRVAIARHLLMQVVFNLVQNAGEALRGVEDALVRVEARPDPARSVVHLSIEDNGPGMTAEVQRRCMEPFFTTKPRGLSTGLGLALVHGIVKKAGGSVAIDSAPDEGTRFTITLPSGEQRQVAHEGAPERLQAAVSLKDARMRTFVAAVLRMLDFEVASSDDPEAEAGVRDARLWITEPAPGFPERARRFVEGDDRRRVVLFGSNGGLQSNQIVELRGVPKPADLRATLRDIVADADPASPGSSNAREADQSALR